jgi:spore germination cell wall hydrolase CwlJ-like protein
LGVKPSATAVQSPAPFTVKFNLLGVPANIKGRIIDGITLVEARHLLESMDYTVEWNAALDTVDVWESPPMRLTPEEIAVLEKIVQAEAGGEDQQGKRLVVNVIWNRLNDRRFPNNVKDIIFQPNQFEPVRNGAYDRAVPSSETKKAVQEALCINHSQGALYFRSAKGATPDCWHEQALKFLFQHGGHRFYI